MVTHRFRVTISRDPLLQKAFYSAIFFAITLAIFAATSNFQLVNFWRFRGDTFQG